MTIKNYLYSDGDYNEDEHEGYHHRGNRGGHWMRNDCGKAHTNDVKAYGAVGYDDECHMTEIHFDYETGEGSNKTSQMCENYLDRMIWGEYGGCALCPVCRANMRRYLDEAEKRARKIGEEPVTQVCEKKKEAWYRCKSCPDRIDCQAKK
ncbi:hypothetical protein FACS189496_4530 [Bacilli bacterium]|nr:hypothetical protein FACS189496_4530 [Bacilli bacterium]